MRVERGRCDRADNDGGRLHESVALVVGLTGPDGRLVADHDVQVDQSDWQNRAADKHTGELIASKVRSLCYSVLIGVELLLDPAGTIRGCAPSQIRELPARITNCVGRFRQIPGADNMHCMAGVYTFAEHAPAPLSTVTQAPSATVV